MDEIERRKKFRQTIDLLVGSAMENQKLASSAGHPDNTQKFRDKAVNAIMKAVDELLSEELFDQAHFGSEKSEVPKKAKLPPDPMSAAAFPDHGDISKVWVDPLPTGVVPLDAVSKFPQEILDQIPIGKTFTVITGKDAHDALIAKGIEHDCDRAGCFDGPNPYDGPGSNEWARKNPAPGITHL